MNPSVIAAPRHGASLAVPGPSDPTAPEPLYVYSRKRASDLLWVEYASLIHPADSGGVAVMAYQQEVVPKVFRTRNVGAKGSELADAIRRHRPKFMTMQGFTDWTPSRAGTYATHPCKSERNLASLGCVWVELDFYKKRRFKNRTAREMVHIILVRLAERGLPYPSFITSSGKGLYIVWLHTRLAAYGKHRALGVWKAVQEHINSHFIDLGRDIAAMTPTTNLRVAGSTNNKRTVQVVWPEFADQIERYDFARLKDEVLPYTAEEVRAYKEEKAAKKVARKAEREARRVADIEAGKPPQKRTFKLTRQTFQRAVMKDLELLFEDRFQGHPVQQGERDLWLYTMTTAAAWLLTPDALRDEVRRLAPLCGLPVRRALSLMGAVLRNADRAAAGKTRSHEGRPGCDYRYRTNPVKIVDMFNVTVEDAVRLDLRVLVPRALKAARVTQRAEAYRRSRGMQDRKAQQAARLQFGRYALERHAAGVLIDELAFEAKARFDGKGSRSWVEKAMREARAVAIGKPQVKVKAGRPKKVEPLKNNPYGSSRSSSGIDKSDATVVTRGRQSYDADVHSVHLTMTDTRAAAVTDPAALDVPEGCEPYLLDRFVEVDTGKWCEWDDDQQRHFEVHPGYVSWTLHRLTGSPLDQDAHQAWEDKMAAIPQWLLALQPPGSLEESAP